MELDQEDWELRDEDVGGIVSLSWRRGDRNRMEAGIATGVEPENLESKGKGGYDGSVPNTPQRREYAHQNRSPPLLAWPRREG